MHCGHRCYSRLRIFMHFSKCPIFWVTKMAKVFAIQAVSRIEYVTLVDVSFRRSLLLSGKLVDKAHFVYTLRLWNESHTRCPIFLHKVSIRNQDIIQWSGSCIIISVALASGVTCGTVLLFISTEAGRHGSGNTWPLYCDWALGSHATLIYKV